MRLVGVVLVFKGGVSVEQARERLKALADVLEDDTLDPREFDPDREGYPVWYIP